MVTRCCERRADLAKEFATAFSRLLEWVEQSGGSRDAPFESLLRDHFGGDPSEYSVTTESLGTTELPNLQLALTAYLERDGVEHELSGFGGPLEHADFSLTALVHDQAWGVRKGPVRRRVVELAGGRALPCVTTGLYLVNEGSTPSAWLVTQGQTHFGGSTLRIEVMTEEEQAGQDVVAELRELMSTHNVYRGKVLALDGGGDFGEKDMAVQFRAVPRVTRDQIVLPAGVLDIVELHTVEFSNHAERLLQGGRHLRRGLLLHGPPGTGKTLTASYLIGRLEGRTVIILSGGGLSLIAEACKLAKDLAPSMVVLEDVDLVAQDRMMDGPTSLLFELLNQIDGIGPDADVIFLMTTNRVDILEPALAARPGRVDQAVAIPLPNERRQAPAARPLLRRAGRGT